MPVVQVEPAFPDQQLALVVIESCAALRKVLNITFYYDPNDPLANPPVSPFLFWESPADALSSSDPSCSPLAIPQLLDVHSQWDKYRTIMAKNLCSPTLC